MRPPPPSSASAPFCAPVLDFDNISDYVNKAKAKLYASLRNILQQKREHLQLIKELQALDLELSNTVGGGRLPAGGGGRVWGQGRSQSQTFLGACG